MHQHPHEHDNVDTTGLPDHDDTPNPFDCHGCHARVTEMRDEAERPYQIEDGQGGWTLVQHPADPDGYPVRWLAQWDWLHRT